MFYVWFQQNCNFQTTYWTIVNLCPLCLCTVLEQILIILVTIRDPTIPKSTLNTVCQSDSKGSNVLPSHQCINNQRQGTRMLLPLCSIKTLRQNQHISESELRFERGGNVPQHHVMDYFTKISLEISVTKTKHMSIDYKHKKCYPVTTKN